LLRAVVVLRGDVQDIARDRQWPKEVRALAREAVSDFDAVVRMPSPEQLHALATQAVQKES
jgi:hypothetical protein